MLKHHTHAVPIVGGPLDGDSATSDGSVLLKVLPMWHDGKFYEYELCVVENKYSYTVYYEFVAQVNTNPQEPSNG